MNHLSRMFDYIVIDSGAALGAAPRTFAARGHLKHGRQLTRRYATGHTPLCHGHPQTEAEVAEHEPTQLPFKYGARTVHSSALETERIDDRTIPVTQRDRRIPLVFAARASVDRDGFVVSPQQDA